MTTFGIEFEVTMPQRVDMRTLFAALPGWPVGGDSTISPRRRRSMEYTGYEMRSPVLSGVAGLAQVRAACEAMRTHDGFVNRSTGCHVHIGYETMDEAQIWNVRDGFIVFQNAFYGVGGGSAPTRLASSWCPSYQPRHIGMRGNDTYGGCSIYRFFTNRDNSYHRDVTEPTIEFRCFAGTVNPRKAVGAILLCHALVLWAREHDARQVLGTSIIRDPREALRTFTENYLRPEYLPDGEPVPVAVAAKLAKQMQVAATRLAVA